jgi:hypothetical protein
VFPSTDPKGLRVTLCDPSGARGGIKFSESGKVTPRVNASTSEDWNWVRALKLFSWAGE